MVEIDPNMKTAYDRQIVENLKNAGKDFSEKVDILPETRFFPQNPDNDDDIIYINQAYWDRFHKRYEKIVGLREVINNFILHPTSHAQYQKRIPNLMTNAVRHGEFWNLEIIGGPGSGKSMFNRGYLVPLHATKMKRNFNVHVNINGMDDKFQVNMLDVLRDLLDKETDAESAMKIKKHITENIDSYNLKEPFDVYVTYDVSETNHVVKSYFKSGDVIFQDETPMMHGKGSTTSKDNIENTLKVSARALHLNFSFISPVPVPFDTVHYYIDVIGYVRSKQITAATLMVYDQNRFEYVGCAEFKLFDIPGLNDYYERVSREMKNALKEKGGYSAYKPNKKEKEALVRELVDDIIADMEANNIAKASLAYVRGMAMDNEKIAANIDKDDIIAAAHRRANGMMSGDNVSPGASGSPKIDHDDQDDDDEEGDNDRSPDDHDDQVDKLSPELSVSTEDSFKETDEMIVAAVNKVNIKEPRQAQYYISSLKKAMVDVAVDFGVTESAISQAWTKINKQVCQQIGREYEKWYSDWLIAHADQLKIKRGTDGKPCVVHNGEPSREDIVVEYLDDAFDIISVKWRNPHQGKPSFAIESTDLNPEIIKTRIMQNEGKKARCVLHVKTKGRKKTINDIINANEPRKNYTFTIKDFAEA